MIKIKQQNGIKLIFITLPHYYLHCNILLLVVINCLHADYFKLYNVHHNIIANMYFYVDGNNASHKVGRFTSYQESKKNVISVSQTNLCAHKEFYGSVLWRCDRAYLYSQFRLRFLLILITILIAIRPTITIIQLQTLLFRFHTKNAHAI